MLYGLTIRPKNRQTALFGSVSFALPWPNRPALCDSFNEFD